MKCLAVYFIILYLIIKDLYFNILLYSYRRNDNSELLIEPPR